MGKGKKKKNSKKGEGEEFVRTKIPKKDEMFGIVEQRVGWSKVYVRCQDGKVRLGRIPGKYSRRLWIRETDLVIAVPWPVQGDKKCDIIYRYTQAQRDWLARKGILPSEFR